MVCINPRCTVLNRGDMYLIKNNESGKIYKINEKQYEFINNIKENENNFEKLEFIVGLDFIKKLMDIGVVIEKNNEKNNLRKKFVFDDLWHFRFEILNPNALCNKIIKISNYIFLKIIIVLIILLVIFFSVIFLVENINFLMRTTGHINAVFYLLVMYLSSIFLSVGHEFSHALLCKKFGGNVDEMGITILYLNPCFYCNISDSYLFNKKWKRVLVPAIGIIYDIFASLAVVVILRYVVNIDWIYIREYLKFTYIMLLFEMNPLLKHDGYYVLTELFSVYNLRENAIKELKKFFSKEKKIKKGYLFYGIASCIYLIFHLSILVQTLFGLGKMFFINKY